MVVKTNYMKAFLIFLNKKNEKLKTKSVKQQLKTQKLPFFFFYYCF